MEARVPMKLESRRLEDGRGGVFFDGQLIDTFATEAESDSAALAFARHMVVAGLFSPNGPVYKDDQPIDLFDMKIR